MEEQGARIEQKGVRWKDNEQGLSREEKAGWKDKEQGVSREEKDERTEEGVEYKGEGLKDKQQGLSREEKDRRTRSRACIKVNG